MVWTATRYWWAVELGNQKDGRLRVIMSDNSHSYVTFVVRSTCDTMHGVSDRCVVYVSSVREAYRTATLANNWLL